MKPLTSTERRRGRENLGRERMAVDELKDRTGLVIRRK